MVLSGRDGRQIRINASIVEEIATIKKKNKNRFEMLTKESADGVRRIKGSENITEKNFQRVPGGKIQMLLGLDIGRDFFPKEISTYKCGLQISEYRIKLFNENRYLGFRRSFPAHFTSMYSPNDHPKALLMQECPEQLKEEERSVFPKTASAKTRK